MAQTTMTRERTTAGSSRPAAALAYTAAAWAFAFAVISAYWALGGTVGIRTIAADIGRVPLANDPRVVGATAVAKAIAGLLVLSLARPWGHLLPRRLRLAAVWIAGAVFALYGIANLVDHGRMVAGFRATPEILGERAARWHLLLWDPWWLLGGVLFLAAAWQARKGDGVTGGWRLEGESRRSGGSSGGKGGEDLKDAEDPGAHHPSP